jgi:hypothetical protein
MRATINFEVDVDQVENTMAVLIAMEADTLRAVADLIDVNPGPRTMVLEEVTEAMRLLSEVASQLQQYRDMLTSFKRARFETILPQAANAALKNNPTQGLGEVKKSMKKLDTFLARINKEEADEDPKPEEG